MELTDNLEALLARGPDSAMLRFTLAARYSERGELDRALVHAEAAVALDADYSPPGSNSGRFRRRAVSAPRL